MDDNDLKDRLKTLFNPDYTADVRKYLQDENYKLITLLHRIYEDLKCRAETGADGTKICNISRGILKEMQDLFEE